MSEQTTPQDATATTDASPVDALVLEVAASSAEELRVSDAEGFFGAVSALTDAARNAVSTAKRYATAVDHLAAARVAVRSFIIRANGFPDWAADTDAYKTVIGGRESTILSKLSTDDAGRLRAATRKAIGRKHLLPAIVRYVILHEEAFEDMRGSIATDEGWETIMSNPSPELASRVRDHFRYCCEKGLTVPDGPFKANEGETPTGGPSPGDPPNPAAKLTEAVGSIETLAPAVAMALLLKGLSSLSRKLVDGKTTEVKNRSDVISRAHRVALVAGLTADALEGKLPANGEDMLSAAYYDPNKDKDA